jgi:DNA-binding NarL/FixJ family response regulator
MRVILIGPSRERARLRSQLNGTGEVVGEFATMTAARAAGIEADAFLVSPVDRVRDTIAPMLTDSDEDAFEEPLTPREIEVLDLLAEGLANKAIAARLGISDQTVKFHVASISGKLGAANRTDAVRRGLRRGLITL